MPSPEVMGSGSLCPGGRLAWSQCPHTLQASALCLQSCRSLDLQTRAHYLMEGTDRKASLSSRLSLFFLTPSPLFIRLQALGSSPSSPRPRPCRSHTQQWSEGALAGPRKLDCRGQMAELRLHSVFDRGLRVRPCVPPAAVTAGPVPCPTC